jgi:fumarate reductase flavoprotein subunit
VGCVYLNGAHPLGSNSLTECLVFGASAGEGALAFSRETDDGKESALTAQADAEAARIAELRGSKRGDEKVFQIREELHEITENGCGVYRQQDTMQQAVTRIAELKQRVTNLHLEDSSKVFNTELISALEIVNMIDVAESMICSAVERKESRGAHTCRDFAKRDDENYLHHSLAFFDADGGAPRIGKKEVTLGHWVPEERKY